MDHPLIHQMRDTVRTLAANLNDLSQQHAAQIDIGNSLVNIDKTARWLDRVASAETQPIDVARLSTGLQQVSEAQYLVTGLIRGNTADLYDSYRRLTTILGDLPGNDPTDF